MATHFSILAGKFQGQRSLVGYSPGVRKESEITEHTYTLSTNPRGKMTIIRENLRHYQKEKNNPILACIQRIFFPSGSDVSFL